MYRFFLLAILTLMCTINLIAQNNIDYSSSTEYEIGGITVSSPDFPDEEMIILLTGINIGDRIEIPGEKITNAINVLWKQKTFNNVKISISHTEGDVAFIDVYVEKLPQLSKFTFKGTKKSETEQLREELDLSRNKIVNENLLVNAKNKTLEYFIDKGFLNADVKTIQIPDTSETNKVILYIDVNKGSRVKINKIKFTGNSEFEEKKLKRFLKNTKEKGLRSPFKSSKYISEEYQEDIKNLIVKYNEKGYRDAQVINTVVETINNELINVEVNIGQGKKYYFRNISWLGNIKYSDTFLGELLSIKKGDVYDVSRLESGLYMSMNGTDISSLYLDDGYLFFSVNPVEILVENDSIDLQIRLYEGGQATVNKVTISGNTRTNDHVIMREIRTKPGELFSRIKTQRTIRELANLGFFDPEQLNVNPVPDPQTGKVDLEYSLVEKSSSQIELQGGWGAGTIIGTFRVVFDNFSAKKFFKKGAWTPLPSGDGQRFQIGVQSSGRLFQSYSASFTEPWLGGKRPNSFTVSLYHNVQAQGLYNDDLELNVDGKMKTTGLTIGLGKRLTWPDDYFTLYQAINLKKYGLESFESTFFDFADGSLNNLNLYYVLGRNSIDQPIFPRTGSNISLTLQFTPPYSLLNKKDYSSLSAEEKYKFLEYHKWKFKAEWYTTITNNLVLKTGVQTGFLFPYNNKIGHPPFERFYVGGDGLQNFVIDGRETIGLRGYPNNSLSPENGGTIYAKYTFEFRYPLSLNPNSTIYGLMFGEAGNSWSSFNKFKPFQVKRSLGAGIRIFMPMFGLLGFDFGYGFDNIPGTPEKSGWQTHFIIGQQF